MMASNVTQLQGVDELMTAIKAVTEETQRKTGRAALRKAANVLRLKAIASARRFDDPETTEDVSKNIAINWNNKTFKRTGNLHFSVGVQGGAKKGGKAKKGKGGDTWYFRFVEFGTQHSAAQPFLRPAMESGQAQASQAFVDEYKKGIDRAIKRAAKKGLTV